MRVIQNIDSMRKVSHQARSKNKSIGFVPTMGYLHKGHLSLIKKARRECDFVIISIYVNPIQFGPKEDYKRYPRDLKRDKRLAREEKVDVVFIPKDKDIYPDGYQTYVDNEGSLSEGLCGATRPGHFKGVCTIVCKLFNIIKPDRAYFGQKDYQQAQIVKQMVRDLNMDVKIRVLPTVRDEDGLAISSRNEYLSLSERRRALILYRSLQQAKRMIKEGIKDVSYIRNNIKDKIKSIKPTKIDYIEIVDSNTLKRVNKIDREVLIALAVWIGRTRLIDNMIISCKPQASSRKL